MPSRHTYQPFQVGIETFPRGNAPARHLHLRSYASLVLAGSFVEAGFAGRAHVEPGDVLLHGRFDCHVNSTACSQPVKILRLPWRDDGLEGHFQVGDADLIARIAEYDPRESAEALAEDIRPVRPLKTHWAARLASDLQTVSTLSLRQWASAAGCRPEALSRGFFREFAVTPKQFRLQARTRRAWCELMSSEETLTTIAHEQGFSDLAHLSRSVRSLTGRSPSEWRQSRAQFRSSPGGGHQVR